MNDCRFLTIAQSSASLAYHKPLLARRSEPYMAKEATMHELKNCSGGRRGDRRICAAKMASARIEASGYSLTETIAMDVAGLIFAVSRTRCR